MGNAIALGRVGHYHNPGSGSCQTALVVKADVDIADSVPGDDVMPEPRAVNLAVWQHDGEQFRREGVPVGAPKDPLGDQGDVATFHLNLDCPWGR